MWRNEWETFHSLFLHYCLQWTQFSDLGKNIRLLFHVCLIRCQGEILLLGELSCVLGHIYGFWKVHSVVGRNAPYLDGRKIVVVTARSFQFFRCGHTSRWPWFIQPFTPLFSGSCSDSPFRILLDSSENNGGWQVGNLCCPRVPGRRGQRGESLALLKWNKWSFKILQF